MPQYDATQIKNLGGPVVPSNSRLAPLGPREVRIVGGFWADQQRINAEVTLHHCDSWLSTAGWIGNFDRVAAGEPEHAGTVFADSEVYKLLEAMAWQRSIVDIDSLQGRFDDLVARIGRAQSEDGYLNTAYGRPGQPPRYSDLEQGHELYCLGHLIQAAVARIRTGHHDRLVDIAVAAADHVVREFGAAGRDAVCGHPEIEMAMVELGRALGRPDYVDTASLFISRRGRGLLEPGEFGSQYFQDDVPVTDANVFRGHAVRALYLASGAYDVAVESAGEALAAAVRSQWGRTVARRTYLTGGMGSHHQDESFGADWELPPDRAYAETCAAIASVMLSWRLLLDTGEVRYADLIERTLFNTVLAGRGHSGDRFFYINTLHQRELGADTDGQTIARRSHLGSRAPWFDVSCCPTNSARLLASVGLYFATADNDGVQLHQYADMDIDTVLPDGRVVALQVRTGYPVDGRVEVTYVGEVAIEFTLTMRVPQWAAEAHLDVFGEVSAAPPGWTSLARHFEPGSRVLLELPIQPRFVAPDRRVDAIRGQRAVERGPRVLCLESTDLPPGISVNDIELVTGQGPESTADGARVRLRVRDDTGAGGWSEDLIGPNHSPPAQEAFEVNLVPYHLWANRGPSTMRIWMPERAEDC